MHQVFIDCVLCDKTLNRHIFLTDSTCCMVTSVGRHWLFWSRLVSSSKVATSTESVGDFLLAHSDGLYIVNLYRNVGKTGKLLNSTDYKSFFLFIFWENIDKLAVLCDSVYFWGNGDFYSIK